LALAEQPELIPDLLLLAEVLFLVPLLLLVEVEAVT